MTKEEHAKVLAALSLALETSYSESCNERFEEAAAIMRKEPPQISDAEILKIRNEVSLKWYADTSKNFDLMFGRALLEKAR